MKLTYADTSALARAYLSDEKDHLSLREVLLESDDPVISCELARLELASAVRSAFDAGRLKRPSETLSGIDSDLGSGGPIILIPLKSDSVLPFAHGLISEHRLRTLDAIHVAVAWEEFGALTDADEVVFVTRDKDQAAAARSLGLAVG